MIKKILLVVLVLLILFKLWLPDYNGELIREESFVVPGFELETLDNEGYFSSQDISEGLLMLTFMSYNCGYCTKQAMYFNEKGFELPIYVISVDFDREGVMNWKEKAQLSKYYTKFGLLGNDVGLDFGIRAIPVSFIIKDGVVVRKIIGVIDEARLALIRNSLLELVSN